MYMKLTKHELNVKKIFKKKKLNLHDCTSKAMN